jgi:hypothetical protein
VAGDVEGVGVFVDSGVSVGRRDAEPQHGAGGDGVAGNVAAQVGRIWTMTPPAGRLTTVPWGIGVAGRTACRSSCWARRAWMRADACAGSDEHRHRKRIRQESVEHACSQ